MSSSVGRDGESPYLAKWITHLVTQNDDLRARVRDLIDRVVELENTVSLLENAVWGVSQ